MTKRKTVCPVELSFSNQNTFILKFYFTYNIRNKSQLNHGSRGFDTLLGHNPGFALAVRNVAKCEIKQMTHTFATVAKCFSDDRDIWWERFPPIAGWAYLSHFQGEEC